MKKTATATATATATTTVNVAATATEACINASFNAPAWTSELYEVVSARSTNTLGARQKGRATEGLLATLLLQPVASVLDTLTSTIAGLPAGTEKRIVVIRSGVAASDPVPAKCKYIDGEWISEVSTNLRQIFKQAIRAAFAALASRDARADDSYTLPVVWKGKVLEWSAAPGSKDDGFYTVVDAKAKKEAAPVKASVEPRSPLACIFAATAKHTGAIAARHLLMPVIEDMVTTYRLAIPGKLAALAVEQDKRTAYAKAMAKAKIREQYKAFLTAGLSETTIALAMTAEHGEGWKATAQMA